MVQKLECECKERKEAEIDSLALFEEIKEYFEEQVLSDVYDDKLVDRPYYVWESGTEKMIWYADKWYKCKVCGCLWEFRYPEFPASGFVRKFPDGSYRERGY
jgi:hypothetical protein